ncbi:MULTISPECIES: hypothetical protein [Ensifer]|jgi:hypothetical protein|uniref:DUF6894 family protein n=1 Tax=Ensifer TaxID=106591 RepID=UPI00042EB9C9|nr:MULTISPECIES: hypothetical protein [Ensifer]AHK44397.1 hypothetical protein OV14_2864 [Ensifer adhaerens OV14]MDP9630512.1 hypothetical protein [Ensifer adhaerens]KQU85912.1 hypothetical protein ASD00_05730 [Ensifer sp. Root31]KQW59007.1 hypothetical protein ASD02_08630 [Ensifer sp. Root1252]KQW74713.1 hypothetical protein ASD03_09270 [Ensifer sp. Root127]
MGWGNIVQVYFFDLYWGDERFVDEDGISHFDEGSALYYGQRIADKIGRDADYGSLRVHVRSGSGEILATIAPSDGRGREQDALIGRGSLGVFRRPTETAAALPTAW